MDPSLENDIEPLIIVRIRYLQAKFTHLGGNFGLKNKQFIHSYLTTNSHACGVTYFYPGRWPCQDKFVSICHSVIFSEI